MKQSVCALLAVIMLVTAFPIQTLAEAFDHNHMVKEKSNYINQIKEGTFIQPLVLPEGKKAGDIIKNPDMPKLYTIRADYKVPRNEEQVVGYQPYIATVGDEDYTYTDFEGNEGQKVLTEAEKYKINKTIDLPTIDGYTSPTKSFTVNYDYIKENEGEGYWDGNEYKREHPYLYKAKQGTIKIKHTFQELENRDKYGLRDGDKDYIYTYQNGITGTVVTIKALDDERIKGYVPEVNVLTTQVPQNSADFEIEMRYNRAIFDVNFDSNGGTDLPGMTLIYGQTIPKLNFDIKKLGSELQGWKVNKDITYTDQAGNKQTLSKDTLITKADFEPGGKFKDGIKNAMPAEGLTFTAQWTENDKAEYVIQFWTEKPDYDDKDDTLPLRDRYDFIGARRIDDADTGSTPELTNLDIHGITFPDLNDGRLEKAQNSKEEFARYYFLNADLTKKQNASEKDPNVQKSVSATGETVYNVYYDRRVYTLYFTAYNLDDPDFSYWPIITRDGQVIGKEGSPYKVDVRFNQSLKGIWPKDAEISGLPKGDGSDSYGDDGLIGWYINNNNDIDYPQIFRDTPPYRLSAEDFVDAEDVMGTDSDSGHGHADKIPIGENQTKDRGEYEISLGASYYEAATVHHIDFIKDDFDGKEQIDYDMSYWKSDTSTVEYDFILPHLQGFTLKQETRWAEWVGLGKDSDVEKTFDDLNAERKAKTPFRSDADKIEYIDHFPWSNKSFNGRNAYNYASYSRNKYKLKLNNDPKTVKNDSEYGEDNVLEAPYELPLKDLQLDTKHVPERPDWVPEDWSFLGWALDPAGNNLVKDGNETKLHYDQVLYAKWGEPETIWKVKFDPNGGSLRDLSTKNISDESKKLEIDGKTHTYPEKVTGEDNTFKFVHKMILKEPQDGVKNVIEPTRPGYNFVGWEFVRYTKDKDGNDTETVDTSYKDLYKVPEMYHFGNEVVGNVHLRAVWNKQDLITVKAIHHFLNLNYEEESKDVQNLQNKRVGSYTTGLASRQGDKYLLVPQAEWEALYNANADYKKYKDETGRENSYNQILKVEAEKVHNEEGELVDNPNFAKNRFEFFYKPFKERVYEVNYLDERGKTQVDKFMEKAKAAYQKIKNDTSMPPEAKSAAYKELLAKNKTDFKEIKEKYTIVPNETVINGKRHYDARNYRRIPGWVLNDKPQQQVFFDIYEDTDTFAGINETGLDEINFFYKDVRVIEVKDPNDPVPDGYVRVTFKADNGGNFTDAKDNLVRELYYDVIVGLKSDNLLVPEEVKEGEEKVEGKYYITPDAGKKFTKWDNEKLLNSNTIIDKKYTFTAYFDWSGVKVHELVRTESYKDPDGNWINNFAPTLDELKDQVKWVNKNGKESGLPKDATVTIMDEAGNELTQDAIYKKLKELGKLDSEELVRTVNFKAKVNFADNSVQDIEIPVKIYKNRYEALTSGEKPEFLSKAENGELKDITGGYVKVTVNPTGKAGEKDSKIYYVNPKAWVEIPEIKLTEEEKEKLGFTHWTSNNNKVNTNGEYIFEKDNIKQRYMFTEDTLIYPEFSNISNTVTLTYEAGEGTGTPPSPQSTEKGKAITLADSNGLSKENAVFKGWKIGDQIYRPGQSVTLTEDSTATAVWTTNGHTVNFNTNGGSYIASKTVEHGQVIGEVTPPEKADYTFTGWTLDEKAFDPTKDPVTQDMTLEAQYVPNVIPQTGDQKPGNVPEYFVLVTVDPTDKATDPASRLFWVNPNKTVKIPAEDPTGKKDGDTQYVFDKWEPTLVGQFKEGTTITAQYREQKPGTPVFDPTIQTRVVTTDLNVQPGLGAYQEQIKSDKDFTVEEVVQQPEVGKDGMTSAKVRIRFRENGMTQLVDILVYVKPGPDIIEKPYPVPQPYPSPYPVPVPGQTKTETVYKDRQVLRREVRYMEGFQGKFRPDDGLTRAEAAQILANALKQDGYPFDLNYKLPYKDTKQIKWFNDAVKITTQAKVFVGYDDGEFKPNQKISRAEWIATLRRFQYVDKEAGNAMKLRPNHWAMGEIQGAYKKGWLTIYTEGLIPFAYDAPITRKEVAAVSNRAFRRIQDEDFMKGNENYLINYSDINPSMWAYYDILCASNTFLHQRGGRYIAYGKDKKAYSIDVKDAIIEQDLFQWIPRQK